MLNLILADIPELQTIDWTVIGIFFAIVLGIGWWASRTAGKNTSEFFLGGRSMPWWLLGVSMVACTFSCDTPNLVTGLVREGGVTSNWCWWAFLITGMVTVFIYAQLWRRSRVLTDLEFYELRYGGKSAAFLRGFRSIYLGFFFNILIMASVTLAAIKIGGVILGLDPFTTVVCASFFVVVYASLGGIKGVIWADFFQYSIAMGGAVYAAYVACGEAGGLDNVLSNPLVTEKMSVIPEFNSWLSYVPLLIIPIAVQWWTAWYPGAEPGGGGYVAQRMLSAKDEKNAIGATLFFNFCHYAMRPWPWIIVALASIVLYPDLASIKAEFPSLDPTYIKDDIAYPVMISKLGPGFLGLIVASLIAAYMSTIGTHLNWGSSYAVNDFYHRFIRPKASQKELVNIGRLCTVMLMIGAGTLALTVMNNATQAFNLLILSGAGTGLVYLLRWFWWRINATTEIVAMIVATILAILLIFSNSDKVIKEFLVKNNISQDHILVINDANALQNLEATQKVNQSKLKPLEEKQRKNIEDWKLAKKDKDTKPELFKAACAANIEVEKQIKDLKNQDKYAYIILNYAKAAKNNELSGKIDKFVKKHYDKELIKANNQIAAANKKLLATNKDAKADPQKTLYQVQKIEGFVANGKIYLYHPSVNDLLSPARLLIMTIVVTLAWVITTLLTKPEDDKTLRNFYLRCHPGGPGWRKVVEKARQEGVDIDPQNMLTDWKMPIKILCVFIGCIAIYTSLFSVGQFVYGYKKEGFILGAIAAVSIVVLFALFGKISTESGELTDAQAVKTIDSENNTNN